MVPKLGPPSMKTLLAGVRVTSNPEGTAAAPTPRAAHVSSAPDPMLEGRVIYSIAIQMPNVTSYSGSWLVWFAEHEQKEGATGDVRAPVPLRKVDPKYVASAAADGVQGVVRLAAVIRRNGHVDTIQLLRHLDDRLDASAMESLAKWEFEPAARNGTPLDVDAVFEIPFRLAPKSSK
jgi:TonB family protein